MPHRASKLTCSAPGCRVSFYAARSDTLYCSDRCRSRTRMEDAKFTTPIIPKSNIPGITFNRVRKRWEVRILENNKRKYVGSFKTLSSAIDFNHELETISIS